MSNGFGLFNTIFNCCSSNPAIRNNRLEQINFKSLSQNSSAKYLVNLSDGKNFPPMNLNNWKQLINLHKKSFVGSFYLRLLSSLYSNPLRNEN